ncbi:MAG: sigma 54-interacting transcriptional regulator [Bacteroidetes bacterium]|nr:sigma 54-interacting transcriptional regulator [Bacteroidota bacterium]
MDNLRDQILDSISEAVFTVDKNLRITYFNSAAEELTGHLKEEVLNKICKRVFNPSNCCAKCPMLMVLESKKKVNDFYSEICTSSGERKQVKMSASLLRADDGTPEGGIISVTPVSEIEKLKRELEGETDFHGIVGRTPGMREIFDIIQDVAPSDVPVFIRGESGTGKEMVANAIQILSNRRFKPYLKVSCSIFHDNLLVSELFGHAKGAFTDAHKERTGRFEIADTGTIFLDEIAEIPLSMQIKLLRVLQEGTFERLGESTTRKVDVRVIAATNIDIDRALASGTMREDLYYRLNVVPIVVPPLRKRRDDIPLLVHHFLKKFSSIFKSGEKFLDDDALDVLMKYDWPGNIRELENVMEYLFVRSRHDDRITASRLPENLKNPRKTGANENERFISTMFSHDFSEKERILTALTRHRWNKGKVASELNMGRTTLWRKMKALGIEEK